MRSHTVLPSVEPLESLMLCASGAGTVFHAHGGRIPPAEIRVQAAAEQIYATLSLKNDSNVSLRYQIQFINPNTNRVLFSRVETLRPQGQQAWYHTFPAPGTIPTIKVSYLATPNDPTSLTTTYLTPENFTLNHVPSANFINQNSVTYRFGFNTDSGQFYL